MKELWLIIAVTVVGILAVIAVALLTRKKQAFRDGGLWTLASTLLVLGILSGNTDRLFGYSLIGSSVVLSIIAAVKSSRKK